MKKHILLLASLFIFSITLAGIYRHDKKRSEYEALAAQPQFNCVGQVLKNKNPTGSCVLVSPKYVLSAAHCFIERYVPDTTPNPGGEPRISIMGNAANYSVFIYGREYKLRSLTIYPDYKERAPYYHLDLALLELEEEVKEVMPAILNTNFDELHADVTGVGFGVYGPANNLDSIVSGHPLKLAGENVIDSIDGPLINNAATVMWCDFDHPTNASCNKMGSAIPRPLEYVCGGGDSGCGLFRKTNTGWELIGICHTSRSDPTQLMKTGYYGMVMGWSRVSAYAGWIKGEMNKAH
jgi:hypothetical protein